MKRPAARLVYDRDAVVTAAPIACRCEKCTQVDRSESPLRTMLLAGAGVTVGTLLPFAWDAHGMISVLASMCGVRL